MNEPVKTEVERDILIKAQEKGSLSTLFAWMRLSGPGWLQSAITLGGGSLAGSLYLGVLAGFALLWLQPLFMILGIIMLSAIGYVTLSTGERPFQAINKHVNPVLGWSWALASLMANIVWSLPQFSLANGVIQQNLAPEVLGANSSLGDFNSKLIISLVILAVTMLITWSYGSGHWGVRLYEILLKLMVATIVVCFFVVGVQLARQGQLNFSELLWGFIPTPQSVTQPAAAFTPYLEKVGEYRDFWTKDITSNQLDILIAAAATAVGINMTFLFPYSLLRKGWTKEFRGLQKFDLATGMFIPFVLATSCVVIASASRFHGQPIQGLVAESAIPSSTSTTAPTASEAPSAEVPAVASPPTAKEREEFRNFLVKRLNEQILREKQAEYKDDPAKAKDEAEKAIKALASGQAELPAALAALPKDVLAAMTDDDKKEMGNRIGNSVINARIRELPLADQQLAAMLVTRDANRLSESLRPLFKNKHAANWLFGIGVVGMALSTITLLMLISGFVVCEMFNLPQTGWTFRLACLPAAIGVLGPFVWSKAAFALAVPTSVFGFMLLPIAYISFFLLMNQKSLLGAELPQGGRRIAWNLLMLIAASVATAASVYMVWTKAKENGLIAIGILLGLALIVQIARWVRPKKPASAENQSTKKDSGTK